MALFKNLYSVKSTKLFVRCLSNVVSDIPITHKLAKLKKDVVVYPQSTCVQDLKDKYRAANESGFYYDHRIIVRDYPEEYTIDKLDTFRTGGVDPDTGYRTFKRIGGGLKKHWYWVDLKRYGPNDIDKPLVERVIRIVDSDCHSAQLALVGHGHCLRWIIATENMKPNDLIRTYCQSHQSIFAYGALPTAPIRPRDGDAWPLAALSTGTSVCCIEPFPGYGARFGVNAGSYGVIQSQANGRTVVRMLPLKNRPMEISVVDSSMAVVGRVGNLDHHKEQLGSANALRRSGYRPRSGWWQRKTGRFGRKLKRIRPPYVIDENTYEDLNPPEIRFTFDDFELRE